MRNAKLIALWLCRTVGLFRAARWITRRHLKILCFHGFAIDDEAEFRPKLFIRPETFKSRLELLERYGSTVLPLSDAVKGLYTGMLPDHSIVITIDDGFHSVLSLAAPALKERGYPATVYVTTYYVERRNPIFRLVVQYLFWKTKRQTLELSDVLWSDDTKIDLSDRAQVEAAVWQCIEFGESQCSEKQRRDICVTLGVLLDVAFPDIARTKVLSLMDDHELNQLCDFGIDIQLHTHRHVFPLDQSIATREILDNRQALMRILGPRALEHFCYPSGVWDANQWPLLDAQGVKSSTTCLPGLNSAATPPHGLHRFLDGENIHPLEFEAAVSGFSDLIRSKLQRRQSQHPAASYDA